MNTWAIFYPHRCAEQAEELVSTFKKVAGPMGVRLERPMCVELRDDRIDTYVKTIQFRVSSEVTVKIVSLRGRENICQLAIVQVCNMWLSITECTLLICCIDRISNIPNIDNTFNSFFLPGSCI